jgi:hypothetical protein
MPAVFLIRNSQICHNSSANSVKWVMTEPFVTGIVGKNYPVDALRNKV